MKRIAILIDGTWETEEGVTPTNVAQSDPDNKNIQPPFVKSKAADGTIQLCFYLPGVGTSGSAIRRFIGGLVGEGLKTLVQDAYGNLVAHYEPGDEIFIFGFSRGAYAARALAGLIGTSGIVSKGHPAGFEGAWQTYRGRKSKSDHTQASASSLPNGTPTHVDVPIKCVAVWETVGSYGVPAGIGLASLARYIALVRLGFHDTRFGKNIDVGLHALGIDEHRRPFVPTFWTIPKDQPPHGHVEQTWFAGAHGDVGGGYPTRGLSDLALVWLIARCMALTGLEFDMDAIKAVIKPDIGGEVVDSTKGWPIDHLFPHLRIVLSPDAIHHGYFFNTRNAAEKHINERVHWSVLKKRGQPCTIAGAPGRSYDPANLPSEIPPDKTALITPEEEALLA